MSLTRCVEFAFLAMYAEDMHHTNNAGAKLLAPDPDPRLASEYDVQAYLVANVSIMPVSAPVQVGSQPLYYGYVARRKPIPPRGSSASGARTARWSGSSTASSCRRTSRAVRA